LSEAQEQEEVEAESITQKGSQVDSSDSNLLVVSLIITTPTVCYSDVSELILDTILPTIFVLTGLVH